MGEVIVLRFALVALAVVIVALLLWIIAHRKR